MERRNWGIKFCGTDSEKIKNCRMKFAVFAKANKILELTYVSLKRFQKTFLKHKWCTLSQFSLKEQTLRIKFKKLLATRQIFADKSLLTWNFKGARKLSFTHYSFVVFILFNTGLWKSAFSTNSFRKIVFYRSALFVFSACYVSNLM